MGFRCGIVGLPNVGKSTLFNALTSSDTADAANYPFCTIEPNVGSINVPDARLVALAEIEGSQKLIPTRIEFVDIAGLVKGASEGAGLGNKFLGHIREVDAIVYVLRCFDNNDIVHVEGRVDPVADAEILLIELTLADLESLQKRLPNMEKKAKQDREIAGQVDLIKKLIEKMTNGEDIKSIIAEESEKDIKMLNLLTTKPCFYVCNVAEGDLATGNQYVRAVEKFAGANRCVIISAQIESEISSLADENEKQEFLQAMGMDESGLNKIVRYGYDILGLTTFFTIGPKEAHAWTIKKGSLAPQAAGEIHTDFEKGFICAEITNCKDYIELGGEAKAKEAGKTRLEGREYIIQDGDIAHFRFNR